MAPDWMYEALAECYDRDAKAAAAAGDFKAACEFQERAVTCQHVLIRRANARARKLRRVGRRRYVAAMNRAERTAWLASLVATAVRPVERPRERRDASSRSSSGGGDPGSDDPGGDGPASREGGRR